MNFLPDNLMDLKKTELFYSVLREFLAHFAGPLLHDVLLEIRAAAAARLADPDPASAVIPQVTVFSGHDVNLLGMIFALNAVVDDDHWPSYGTGLVFPFR